MDLVVGELIEPTTYYDPIISDADEDDPPSVLLRATSVS